MGLVAVVGGAGFVGVRLSATLRAEGHDVRVIDVVARETEEFGHQCADVRSRDSLAGALDGADVVYNLAAVHRDDVKPMSLYDEVNVTGAVNVCDVCREIGVAKIIFASSVAVYGLAAPSISEEEDPEPSSAYGRSKLRAEEVHRQWQEEEPTRRSLVIVRPTVVFGERNRGNVYQLLHQIMTRRFVMVGSGRNRKSMAYVGNVSAFLVHVLGLGAGTHLFNYVDGPDLSMEELVQTILVALGRPPAVGLRIPYLVGYLGGVACDVASAFTGMRLPISALRVKKFCSTTTFSTSRVMATGFRPPTGLREALVKTIKHEVCKGGVSGATAPD